MGHHPCVDALPVERRVVPYHVGLRRM
ncbi:MAG: hypothetical protein K0S65_2272, partial [Labilithrix sp.]|nr:hypothetical protein [Labilithrix sp.]